MISYLYYHVPWQLLMIAIFVQSSISSIKLPDLGIDWSDKLLHFLCFGILGFFLARSLSVSKNKRYQDQYMYWSLFIGSVYGLTDEIHQLFVPGRLATVGDWIADTLGVIVFVLIYKWYKIQPRRHQATKTQRH